MKLQNGYLFVIVCASCFSSAFAQTPEKRRTVEPQNQLIAPNAAAPLVPNSADVLATEIGSLRKSLQTLNKRIGEIAEKFAQADNKQTGSNTNNQNRILLNLEILTRAEQRAEVLRRELIALVERETQMKSRAVQNEEDQRPENIERGLNAVGSTRAPELRAARRRVLENERDGLKSLINQVQQSRQRLETDVREADALVVRLRQRILPLIEKEVDNLEAKQP